MLWLLSSVPQGGHCGEVQPYLKIPLQSKITMHIYMKLCSIFNSFFLLQAEEKNKDLSSTGL